MSEIFSKILKDKNGKVLNVGSKYQQPEWGSETAIVEILPEAQYTATAETEGAAPVMQLVPVEAEQACTVTYNGVAYNCTAIPVEEDGVVTQFALGNTEIMSGGDTGEPFLCIFVASEETASQIGFYGLILPLDGSETFTLSIMGEVKTYTKIPFEYITASKYKQPDWGIREIENAEIMPYQVVNGQSTYNFTSPPTNMPVVGKEYTVTWGGEEYKCTAMYNTTDGIPMVVIGNGDIFGLQHNNEPFMFVFVYPEYYGETGMTGYLTAGTSTVVDFSIRGYAKEVIKVPLKYIERAPIEPLIVELSLNGTTVVIDSDYATIRSAIESGRNVYLKNNDKLLPLNSALDSKVEFACLEYNRSDLRMLHYAVLSDGTIDYSNVPIATISAN